MRFYYKGIVLLSLLAGACSSSGGAVRDRAERYCFMLEMRLETEAVRAREGSAELAHLGSPEAAMLVGDWFHFCVDVHDVDDARASSIQSQFASLAMDLGLRVKTRDALDRDRTQVLKDLQTMRGMIKEVNARPMKR